MSKTSQEFLGRGMFELRKKKKLEAVETERYSSTSNKAQDLPRTIQLLRH